MSKKNLKVDENIINMLKDLPVDSHASLFSHITKENGKSFISFFLESNIDDLSSMLYHLMKEPGFKEALYTAVLLYFRDDPNEKMVFKHMLRTMEGIDTVNLN